MKNNLDLPAMLEDWTCDQLKACAHAKGDYHEGLAVLHLNAVG